MTKATEMAALAEGMLGSFKPFSQSLNGIKKVRTSGGYTSDKMNLPGNVNDLYVGGTCETMSLYWIAGDKAGLGEKKAGFIDWVLPAGPKGAPNMGAVGVIIAKTVMYKAKGAKAEQQGITKDANFESSFFNRYGIRYDHERANGADAMKKAITRSRNRYYLFSYFSATGGHACAAMSSKSGEFAYFDPNYGEARLPVAATMRRWFDGYLRISEYSTKYSRMYCDTWTY
ncbi:MAG: YopT-type cysteine protease domain-containing protein [Rhizobiaceae bacterium]